MVEIHLSPRLRLTYLLAETHLSAWLGLTYLLGWVVVVYLQHEVSGPVVVLPKWDAHVGRQHATC